ncbi:MAG: sialidase family protein [Myxococcota bacterium]
MTLRRFGVACAALVFASCDCTGIASDPVPVLTPEGVHVVSDTPLCPFETPAGAPTSTWSRTGPPGASVQALLSLGQGTLLVGTGAARSSGLFRTAVGGLYRSTDSGRTVTRVQELDGAQVHALVSTSDGDAWAAVGSLSGAMVDGVWRSTDRGASFTKESSGLHPDARVVGLSAAAGSPTRLYALVRGTAMAPLSAATSLYRKDGTADWALVPAMGLDPVPGGPLGAIAADPVQRDRLYAIDGARLYVSDDAGATFTPIAMGWLGNPRSLTVPSPGRLLLGTAADGLYESTDDGVTWTQRLAPVQGELAGVHDVDLDPQGRVFVATEGTGLQRLDGATAAQVGKCLLDSVVLTVAAAKDDAQRVWAGTNGGLYVSDNGGDSFLPAGQGLDELLARVVVAPLDGQPTAFLLSAGGLFYYSAASATWQRQGDWAETVAFSHVAMNADGSDGFLSVDEALFPGRYGVSGGLWRWRRAQHTVERAPEVIANIAAVALDASRAGRSFAYQRGGPGQPQQARTGVLAEAAPDAGFVTTSMVAEHLEGTSTFRFSPLAVAPDGALYSGMRLPDASPALFRSDDQGATYSQVWSQPGWVAYGVYVDSAGAVYVTGWLQDIGIRKSVDRGATFSPADRGLTGFGKFVYTLAFDGEGGSVVGTEGGAFRAATATSDYSDFNEGFSTPLVVWSIAVLPDAPRPVVVAGTSRGVFWRTLP